jgi:hypothetical protein
LGRLPPDAACAHCGTTDVRILEVHHTHGRHHAPQLTIVLCKNGHAIASDQQVQDGTPREARTTPLERWVAASLTAASWHHTSAEFHRMQASEVTAFIAWLDTNVPQWRKYDPSKAG